MLEAVSLLSPAADFEGRRLSRDGADWRRGGFAVAQARRRRDRDRHATPVAPERRQVRINAAPASVNSLSEWLVGAVVDPRDGPAVPGPAGDRRRFLDRWFSRWSRAMRHHARDTSCDACAQQAARPTKRLPIRPGLRRSRQQMAEHGTAIAGARTRTVAELEHGLEGAPERRVPAGRDRARRLGTSRPGRAAPTTP